MKTALVNTEKKRGCTMGIYAHDITAQHSFFSYRENEQRVAASCIKLFFAAAALNALNKKGATLESMMRVRPSDAVFGISVLADLMTEEMSVRNLLYLLLAHSDTSAQNVLEQIVTEKEVNDYIQKNGYSKTIFVSNKKSTRGHLSLTTPLDAVTFMNTLYKKKIGAPEESALLLSFLAQSRMTHFSLRKLPTALTVKNPSITERYSKAGKVYDSVNDTVIVKTQKGTLCLGVFIDNYELAHDFNSVDNESILLIASTAKKIFEAWLLSKATS